MKEQTFEVQTPTEFESVIAYVLSQTTSDTSLFVTLSGDLGAGKTTFTQQLAAQLGVTEPVVSPTFGIIKIYNLRDHPTFDQLVHIDAYRIEDISEVGPLRLQELFEQPRTLICLEWPERISDMLPNEKIQILITIEENESRSVKVVT